MTSTTSGASTTKPDFDSIIIGAGFSGIALLHHLREIGQRALVLDADSDLGGTWWSNNYPGVRTDSEFQYYSFSFSKEVRDEWTWTERYPSGKEVLAYLNFVAERLDLRKDMRFNSRVDRAEYDEESNTWTVHLTDGRSLTATYLISGMGVLSEAIWPDIPGIETFGGQKYHTANWPREGVDLTGKRVGIVGLGASGIQVVPTIAPQVAELLVFQRQPNFIVETNNDKVSAEQMKHVRDTYDEIFARAAAHPFGVDMVFAEKSALDVDAEERDRIFESKWQEGGFHFANECFNDLATNHESSELASAFIRKKIHQIVIDQSVADLLSPTDYSFNGKRVPTGHGYYATFNRDNVTLIDVKSNPITTLTEKGILVGDTEFELDVIIFATGFDAMTGTLTTPDIVGRDGVILRDKWAKGIRTNLGISVSGFPNFFMSLGPQTPYSNLPVPIQLGAQWIARAIKFATAHDIEHFEATPESEELWADEVDRAGKATVMYSEGLKAKAWFLGENVAGKPREFQVYMGGGQVYQQFCRDAEAAGYPTFLATEKATV
ncbi:flavin-containing monooxygenase [Lacisediminihabitans profunda]|uniref:NAD(P)/FAD-dependent oxidoreductase n=1 Tax=Lacisediminihabitans profunda TaxID=2594790 RepID=A0A5C8UVE9_9MICO|nr:NAD(P)/FAD-dependent oxidoreductase [Lacisediminihabitans profunda]TXN32644.1 NAD(P)/FAD-dependent oxidoreductase [Lacisediminihabitans profunda]